MGKIYAIFLEILNHIVDNFFMHERSEPKNFFCHEQITRESPVKSPVKCT